MFSSCVQSTWKRSVIYTQLTSTSLFRMRLLTTSFTRHDAYIPSFRAGNIYPDSVCCRSKTRGARGNLHMYSLDISDRHYTDVFIILARLLLGLPRHFPPFFFFFTPVGNFSRFRTLSLSLSVVLSRFLFLVCRLSLRLKAVRSPSRALFIFEAFGREIPVIPRGPAALNWIFLSREQS